MHPCTRCDGTGLISRTARRFDPALPTDTEEVLCECSDEHLAHAEFAGIEYLAVNPEPDPLLDPRDPHVLTDADIEGMCRAYAVAEAHARTGMAP